MPTDPPTPMTDETRQAALELLESLRNPGAIDPGLAHLISDQLHTLLDSRAEDAQ